jgi:hypothetical protein
MIRSRMIKYIAFWYLYSVLGIVAITSSAIDTSYMNVDDCLASFEDANQQLWMVIDNVLYTHQYVD